jgi:hypothetical protein
MVVKFPYGASDNPTWEVFGNVRSYKVQRVRWVEYEKADLYRKICQKRDGQSHGTLVTLRFDNNDNFTILTAYDVYACADNGDTIERF